MNVLITGAGLIGAHAAQQLVDAGNITLFDLSPNRDYIAKVVGQGKAEVVAANMLDLPALLTALGKYNIDTMVHTAGLIGGRVQENSYTGATNNINGTINVLEAARLRKLRRVVYVSTFGVYERGKINDSVVKETHPIGGHNLYATTKVCSEHLVHAYASMYNLDTIIIRPGGVFGRGFYVGGSTVGMVMRDLAVNMIKGQSITIEAKTYGPNEYVYGKDVGQVLALACKAENPKQRIYNAGTGVVTNHEQLAQAVREVLPTLDVKTTGAASTDRSRSIPMDIGVTKAELGYTPRFHLADALRDYMTELRIDGVA
ncbi:MAG: NAD(P)-dependent oxidoreductase [Deltaproteobacteria bacterium]|nr:NAD(P)-dependent oxidoreductase [Deltaproteobacteria bacterium]MBM4297483.1 NAD(P)-dependent oxidoreductase [Deltaproteobacteria bacterium]